jgi:enoyl-CoA hydratase/carnithine racemase
MSAITTPLVRQFFIPVIDVDRNLSTMDRHSSPATPSDLELKTTRWERHGDHVGSITISRPESRNAWTGRVHTELRHLLQKADQDRSIRAIVITGDPAGRNFCPGADSKALESHVERGGYDPGTPPDIANPGYGVRDEFDADFAYFLGLETVTIAALNGAAAGVGMALACWCDVRIAEANIVMTTAHGKLNLPAEYGLSWLLPRIVGQGRANDILFTSRRITSEEAQQIGLVNQLCAAGEALTTSLAYADRLVESVSPHSLRATKRQIGTDMVRVDPSESVRDAQARLEQMMTEDDYREATAAFLDRRTPRWTDNS